MQPLAYQYNKLLLEETDLYITKELKNLAEDKAKTRGQQQIHNVSFLHLNPQPSEPQQLANFQQNVAETQQQHPEGVASRISQSRFHPASDQAKLKQLDQPSDTYRPISSENFGETADNLPLLHGKNEKTMSFI